MRNPLLNIPIARRLAFGFLIPALIVSVALGSIGIQSRQLLTQEAMFYQGLIHTYSSLTTATGYLAEVDTVMQATVSDAASATTTPETLTEDKTAFQGLAKDYDVIIENDIQHDVLDQHTDLSALFTAAGHYAQIGEQRSLLAHTLATWLAYFSVQKKVLTTIDRGDAAGARTLEYANAELKYAGALNALKTLIDFDAHLVSSVGDATNVEENNLLYTTIFAALCVLLGIGIVGWLVSNTMVRRLQQLRSVVQAIGKGQVNTRLTVIGRDEITDVSQAVNGMLDTIVGLLEETRSQRDALTNAAELRHLHEELQSQHEALNSAHARLEALATTDPLTSLPNHRTIMKQIEEELAVCGHSQRSCAVLFADIDHFKRINDTWGHQAGDTILREVGRRLRQAIRVDDFVGRYGGEEFAIVLTNVDLHEAQIIAERLRTALQMQPCRWETAETSIDIPVTASIGIALYRTHGITREALLAAADRAMYTAKHGGRNRVCSAGEASMLDAVMLAPGNISPTDVIAVQALTAVARVHDNGTSTHAQRMVYIAEATARALGRSEEEIQLVRLAALLHDIGKINIPNEILHKPGPLTDEEWSVMRLHPDIGRRILVQAGGRFELISHIVVAHHERWDGCGYPYGLAQEKIPLGARILSVVDSYDAMTSQRPYREPLPVAQARVELQRCAGSQFDPQVVRAFLHVLDEQLQIVPSSQDEEIPTQDVMALR
ncbi:MAG: diguanylate cyclase [Ktedonobacteraceae bacterium]